MRSYIILLSLFGIAVLVLTMRLNKTGIDLIKESESLRLEPYYDQAGRLTIGYGHLIEPGESFGSITEAEAEALLIDDVRTAENTVNQLVGVPLNQTQFNALVSFVFNVGAGAFAASTLLRKLNQGDYEGARQEFKRWKYVTIAGVKTVSNGLLARREREAQEFTV